MTDQETFDFVARHLLTQREPSVIDGMCMYHGPNGLKCAVGCLMTDEEYKPEWERLPMPRDWLERQGFNRKLLGSLQYVHDASDVAAWRCELAEVAQRFGLSADVLKEFPDA